MTDQESNALLPPGLALAWGEIAGPRRGPKPGHNIHEIVSVAIGLADGEGIGALSLPRIAASVGLTTNALYRYIGSKDELLLLIHDAAWGRPPEEALRVGRWRRRAKAWTLAVIDGYKQRPWLLDIPIRGAPMTPNVLRWLEVLLQAMSGTGLSVQDRLRSAQLLDGYARSAARLSSDLSAAGRNATQAAAISAFLFPRLREHEYPILASMTGGEYEFDGFPDDDIEFGIDRILDGIGVLVTAKTTRSGRGKGSRS